MKIKLLISSFGFDLFGIYPAKKSIDKSGYMASNGRFLTFFKKNQCEVVSNEV